MGRPLTHYLLVAITLLDLAVALNIPVDFQAPLIQTIYVANAAIACYILFKK